MSGSVAAVLRVAGFCERGTRWGVEWPLWVWLDPAADRAGVHRGAFPRPAGELDRRWRPRAIALTSAGPRPEVPDPPRSSSITNRDSTPRWRIARGTVWEIRAPPGSRSRRSMRIATFSVSRSTRSISSSGSPFQRSAFAGSFGILRCATPASRAQRASSDESERRFEVHADYELLVVEVCFAAYCGYCFATSTSSMLLSCS
jgi:hypothetical protein